MPSAVQQPNVPGTCTILGILDIGLWGALAVAAVIDGHPGARLYALACAAFALGISVVVAAVRGSSAAQQARIAFRLGRMSVMAEQALTRRPSRRCGHMPVVPAQPSPTGRTDVASAATTSP